jgi:AcrR family transcriptional regulator
MSNATGLRERKKQRTREAIFEAASRLFSEQGFDAVTVADVAHAADVSEMTVFNYFPTKEDLFFGGMEFFEGRLVQAVRDRGSDVSIVEAFGAPILAGLPRLVAEENAAVIAKASALIEASPALQVREREIVARHTRLLAELLAAETGRRAGDAESEAVANALMGAHRALVVFVRRAVLGGRSGPGLASSARSQARRAFARLEVGFAGYPRKGGRA